MVNDRRWPYIQALLDALTRTEGQGLTLVERAAAIDAEIHFSALISTSEALVTAIEGVMEVEF